MRILNIMAVMDRGTEIEISGPAPFLDEFRVAIGGVSLYMRKAEASRLIEALERIIECPGDSPASNAKREATPTA